MKKILLFVLGLFVAGSLFADQVPSTQIKGSVHGNISWAHALTHQGRIYTAEHYFSSVADDAYAVFLIDIISSTVSVGSIHAEIGVACGGDAVVRIWEGPVCTSSGTALTAYNTNRSIADTPETLFYYTPTILSSGTMISDIYLVGGNIGYINGGQTNRSAEYILDDHSYLIEVTNIAGAAKPIGINVDFYETETR